MIKELEIAGVTYKLVANRNVSEVFEKCVRVDKDGNAKVEMPSKRLVFNALLKAEQPNLTLKETNEILDKADKEYGIDQMNQAIDFLFNSVFTQSSPEKTISWLNEETETQKK